MAEEQTVDAKKAKSFWKKKKTVVCIGALASLGIAALGGWILRSWMEPPPPPPIEERNVTGFLNLQEASRAHPDYRRLQELREECTLLREEIASLLPLPLTNPPQVESKPFDDAGWQKNAQAIIGKRAELERRQKKAMEEYRGKTEEEYTRQREEIDATFLNAITNLRLKLENADVLHYSEETVQGLRNEMENLQRERGERQRALRNQWEEDIVQHGHEAIAEDLAELRAQAIATKEQFAAEAARRQSEAQSRNVQAMEQQMEATQRFQKSLQRRQDLEDKEQECRSLENHIFNDVAGKAAKVAILHHFTMIVANPATRLESLIPWQKWVGPPPERYAPVIASQVEDVTQELINELRNWQ